MTSKHGKINRLPNHGVKLREFMLGRPCLTTALHISSSMKFRIHWSDPIFLILAAVGYYILSSINLAAERR